MKSSAYPYRQGPSGVTVPEGTIVTPPGRDLSDDIKRFWGETGMWWGSWRSPQTRNGFDAIFIVGHIVDEDQAMIVCVVPDYPPWYVNAGRIEVGGRFVRRTIARTSLLFPYKPFGYTMECWFERQKLKGAVHMRFMSAYIELKPLH